MKEIIRITSLTTILIVLLTIISVEVDFENRITGKTISRAIVVQTANASCNFKIEEGWNLISNPCIYIELTVAEQFGQNHEKILQAYSFQSTNQKDPWKSYKLNLSFEGSENIIKDLNKLNRRYGYWIYANSNFSLNYTNKITKPTLIDLRDGWNMIGYPQLEIINISEFEAKLFFANLTIIRRYNPQGKFWEEYSNTTQDFEFIEPYYGYWINIVSTTNSTDPYLRFD